jgi:hypothetical protein
MTRRIIPYSALVGFLAMLTASTTLGALVNGTLPASGYIYTSVSDKSVNVADSAVTLAAIAALERYVSNLSALTNPTTAQRQALATYRARLADYKARYAAAIELRAGRSANVKTTYSRVPPSPTYESGWHYHNGPVIVTVTVGTLTLYDKGCGSWDVSAGHTYIESPREILNAKAFPAKNVGIADVEWFTTRLYPEGAIDPVPVADPCS